MSAKRAGLLAAGVTGTAPWALFELCVVSGLMRAGQESSRARGWRQSSLEAVPWGCLAQVAAGGTLVRFVGGGKALGLAGAVVARVLRRARKTLARAFRSAS